MVLVVLIILLVTAVADEDVLDMEPVWLTVSSLKYPLPDGTTATSQHIIMNWKTSEGPEEVALFLADPYSNSTPVSPIERIRTEDYPSGMYQTQHSLVGQSLVGGWALEHNGEPESGDQCLAFWIGAYRGDTLEHVECLKIRPTWMSDNRLSIGDLPLTSVLWPGTHNSGCYPGPDGHAISPILARFVYTQDQDIWTQLVSGVRYIDLRVGIYPTKTNGSHRIDLQHSFWVNHDLIKVRPLVPILRDIKEFLRRAKGEIVILDFHRFPVGFSGRHARHNRLVELLAQELQDVAVEFRGEWPSLDNLWQGDKQLIIAYGDNEVAKKHTWLWPPVRQQWGNQQTVSGLEEFLECCLNDTDLGAPDRGLWALMAQLTPGPSDLLFRPSQSLRTMAHAVNPHLTAWLRDRPHWWSHANIVTSDFFRGNSVVDIAVSANVRRGSSRYGME